MASARCAEEALVGGEMGASVRRAWYISFLDAYDFQGKQIVETSTSCAMFVGGVFIHAEVQERRPPPKTKAITTWVGVHGFSNDPSWIPGTKGWKRGDVVYICSTSGSIGKKGTSSYYEWHQWEMAADGHVILLRDGEGTTFSTAEGGGSPGGTICRLSKGSKDVAKLSRPARGIWRPDLMARS